MWRRQRIWLALGLLLVAVLLAIGPAGSGRGRAPRLGLEDQQPGGRQPVPPGVSTSRGALLAEHVLLRGIVFDSTGSVAGAGVHVEAGFTHLSSHVFLDTATREDGSFVLKLPAEPRWSAAWPSGAKGLGGAVDLTSLEDEHFRVWAFRSDRAGVSRPLLVQFSETLFSQTGDQLWITLSLVAPATVRARAVTQAGVPVSHARIRFLVSSDRDLPLWQHRAFSPTWYEVVADKAGRATLFVSGAKVRSWARSPDGAFGEIKTGTINDGTLDLGDLTVAGDLARFRVHVEDPDGQVIAAAGIRMGLADSVQRWLRKPAGNNFVHYATGKDGTVEFVTVRGSEAAIIGIGAKGFLSVSAVLDRARPGTYDYTVKLERAPVLRVRVETDAGTPLPSGVSISFESVHWRRPDGSFPARSFLPAVVHLGSVDAAAASHRLKAMDPLPAKYVGDRFSRSPSYDRERAEYTFTLPRAGDYLVRAIVAPGLRVECFGKARSRDAPVVVLRVPRGRMFSVRARIPDHLTKATAELQRYRVWPATAQLPPDDWPANMREAPDAAQTGASLFDWGSHVAELWLPVGYTHIAIRRLSLRNRGKRLAERYDVPSPVPGAVRYPGVGDERFANQQPLRLRVPDGEHPTASFDVQAPFWWEFSRDVTASVLLLGTRLAQAGIPLRAKRVAELPGYENPRRARKVVEATTGPSGRATFRLPFGEYQISVDPRTAPGKSVRVVVRADAETAPVIVPLGER